MSAANPQISASRPVIRQLDEAAINRIAAGEVIERPASAVKELVENAIDAGASRITVEIADGGRSLIRVTDDGCGMAPEDLPLALSRHATSKIDGSDLLDIHSFGFRGEALPSLAAVGRLTITSRAAGCEAALVRVAGGRMEPVRPAALGHGTVVELKDLFYATPARLKFLRTDRAETQSVTEVMRRLALAAPGIGFDLRDLSGGSQREILSLPPAPSLAERARQILGRDFTENAIEVDATRDGVRLSGLAALPTYSRGAAVQQFLNVNGRPVRDRTLLGALKAAYRDVLPKDRYPAVVLNLDCDPRLVDVNVHPAKAEVRFRDPGSVRGLIVSGLRHALASAGHRASSTVAGMTLGAVRPEPDAPRIYQMDRPRPVGAPRAAVPADLAEAAPDWVEPSARVEPVVEDAGATACPLGAARAQLHGTYIVAQTETGIVIVDQHAAHERLVYERLKAQRAGGSVPSQALLIPDIVDLAPGEAERLLEAADVLSSLGLEIEPFGGGAVAVRATPAILGEVDAKGLIGDILDELAETGAAGEGLQARIDAILSRMSCHGSIRANRQMRPDEMNALLRQMEATPGSGQCNHGRPTYVELRLSDIERLFGRS